MKPMNARRNRRGFAQVVALLTIVNIFGAAGHTGVAAADPAKPVSRKPINIVAFGDSLTAGYGVKPRQAFPVQLQKALKERGHNVVIANAGVSGDTTAAGLARLAWAVPDGTDAVIVELGGNDALRGIDPKETRANLEKILSALKDRQVPVLFAGMRSPANWGDGYSDAFDAVFPELARKYDVLFYPFFLEGVVLDSRFNQDDGMHPSGKGVAEIVKRIMPSVEELIALVNAKRAQQTKS